MMDRFETLFANPAAIQRPEFLGLDENLAQDLAQRSGFKVRKFDGEMLITLDFKPGRLNLVFHDGAVALAALF